MLRRILITLGLLIAFLPYLGFPHSWQAVISTVSGLLIVMLLIFSRRGKIRRGLTALADQPEEESKALHVEHVEIEDRPELHVEREVIIDTEQVLEQPNTEITIEKRVTKERRRKKNQIEETGLPQID